MKILCNLIILCLLCCTLSAQGTKNDDNGLHVLILGGTSFVGPHLTNELLSRGHKVTHFNRGNPSEFSFPEAEKLQGDRYGDLTALKGRIWDAIIDTAQCTPEAMEDSSKLLQNATNHYTFISSVSVYADLSLPGINENVPLVDDDENFLYARFKAGCEKVIQGYFPKSSLIVRPGVIVGPYESYDRLTYWVRRISEGGKILVPNRPKQKLQLIDVRDLSKWIVTMIEEQTTGIFNASGSQKNFNFENFVNECAKFTNKEVDFVWADEQLLIERYPDNSWSKIPLWVPSSWNHDGIFCIDSRKAQNKGLSYRPLSETIFDTLRWDETRTDRAMQAGLSREEEEDLFNQIRNP